MQPMVNGATSKKLAAMIASHEGILDQMKEFQALANLCDRLMDIRDWQEKNTEQLDAIEVRLERLEKDHTEPKVIDALLHELDGYRDNFLFKYGTKPYCDELVTLYSGLVEWEASVKEAPIITKAQVSQNVQGLLTQVTQAASRVRLRIVTVKEGIEFDADWHSVVGTEAVDSPQQVGRVIRVVRPLFMYEGKVFRPAEVIVGSMQEPQEVLKNVSICEDANCVGH